MKINDIYPCYIVEHAQFGAWCKIVANGKTGFIGMSSLPKRYSGGEIRPKWSSLKLYTIVYAKITHITPAEDLVGLDFVSS